jgi:protein phosphatase
VERLRARGLITAEEAKHHPAHNTITRAVGAATRLDLDVLTLEVGDGDMFLLCSDGLSNEVEDAGIAEVLAASGGDCAAAANELVQRALVNGGHDNVSVVVLRAEDIGGGSDMTLLNPEV